MMKKAIHIVLASLLALLPFLSSAQSDNFLTVSGIVRDEGGRLPFVSVTIQGSTLGTITNEDGYFTLKIPRTDKEISIVVSHVGYHPETITRPAPEAHGMRIILKPYSNMLDPALVVSQDPEELVRAALSRVRANYPLKAVSQRGFYRETARKGSRYISISEAVVDIYKNGYTHPADYDRIEVLKGRRLMSQKNADTLAVKLQGGPVLALSLDVVKNPEDLFFEEDLDSYRYSMDVPTVIEGKPAYVVNMDPQVRNERYPMYNAKVYIDKSSLAIMRAEYCVDMTDQDLVDRVVLLKKPAGLKFQTLDVSFISSYRFVEDKAVQHYVRCSMDFKCDWKKRLFSSAYNVVTELVATDVRIGDVETIRPADAFKTRDVFYDMVDDFADPDFWGDYNILEPSESLEHAVGRLRRKAAR